MLFIRADSNNIISGGHIMRCLAIAKSMKKAGENVCFITADDNPSQVLTDAGIDQVVLHSDWKDLMTDVEAVKRLLQSEQNPVFLIDTYQVTKEYVDALAAFCKIGYLGSKKEYLGELDFLINYSTDIDYQFYRSHYGRKTELLLGPGYAPLRDEFQNVVHQYKKELVRLLLTTGNTDNNNLVDGILVGLLPNIKQMNIVIDIVIGRMFEDKQQLIQKYGSEPNVELHENVKSMSALMKNCDLAISANGTTVYELSAMGIPTISFAMVEEQVRSAETLSSLGVVDYCGKAYENKESCIALVVERVKHYLEHYHDAITLAKKAHELIDGNGCQKIVEVLIS